MELNVDEKLNPTDDPDWKNEVDRLITVADVEALIPLKRHAILRMEASGNFPPRRKIAGARRVTWLLSDVTDWLKNLEGGFQSTRKAA